MLNKLKEEIREVLAEWNLETFPENIKVLNFGLQKVYDSYELNLEGFEWYDEASEIWLFEVAWTPRNNYVELSSELLKLEISTVLTAYKEVVAGAINSGNIVLPENVKVVTVSLVNGVPTRLI